MESDKAVIARPILFSGPMVRALLEGRKTQTRRVAKLTAGAHVKEVGGHRRWHPGDPDAVQACPYGGPGTALWVRESHAVLRAGDLDGSGRDIRYRADDPDAPVTWCPSIHMPRWASRITLEVESVRIERLHAITEEDAVAEGVEREDLPSDPDNFHPPGSFGYVTGSVPFPEGHIYPTAREAFAALWDTINGKRAPWSANPWVWALALKVVP